MDCTGNIDGYDSGDASVRCISISYLCYDLLVIAFVLAHPVAVVCHQSQQQDGICQMTLLLLQVPGLSPFSISNI
jgi:hypothetical protein